MQTFVGGQVFLPDQCVETTVSVADGVIVDIGGPVIGTEIDARGKIVAPALIDVHGDAFERQLMPRAGVFFPTDAALLDTDRQLAANGIATAYHAITLSWEPGLRAVDRGWELMRNMQALAPRLLVENRVQLRWETFAFEALELIDWALQGPLTPALAFNDHTSMSMRAFDTRVQDRPFELASDFSIASFDDARLRQRTAGNAKRAGLSEEAYIALLRTVWGRRSDVPATIAEVAQKARSVGAPMLSHDDTRAETRRWFRDLGATVAEFPMVMAAAEEARQGGDSLIFGAPNAARGASHIGSLSAGDMVEAGLCDALASDYFYPAMLAAIARLDAEKRADRLALWHLVSQGPARTMHLHDRGQITKGLRADLVVLDWPAGHPPAVMGTWVAGRPAFRAVAAG